jgi:DNA-binding transcriptional LysR family regulator
MLRNNWEDFFVMPRPSRLSLELLETFVALAEYDGDATRVAEQLGVNQPSVSKRLAAIRRLTGERIGQSWLVRKGKRWRLTAEGQRVRVVVTDMVRRYEEMERFVASGAEGKPLLALACGQQAASGFVGAAVERFLVENPGLQIRLSTPRGRRRIEGVAGGQFDLVLVTDAVPAIRKIARREMYIESLFDDHFVLIANPPARSALGRRWHGLPADQPVPARELLDLPFVLPEPDASRRKQFDNWCYRATGKMLNVALAVGGWQTILEFVSSGIGIGLVPHSAVEVFRRRGPNRLTTRPLDPSEFPPDAVRLVARKAHGKEEPDLTEHGKRLVAMLREQVPHSSRQGASANNHFSFSQLPKRDRKM